MTVLVLELCKGSGSRWKLGINRHCPVCTKSSATIAAETETTGNAGTIPRHTASARLGR